jgi:hypothetical protein
MRVHLLFAWPAAPGPLLLYSADTLSLQELEMKVLKSALFLGAALSFPVLSPATVSAGGGVNIGSLNCTVEGGFGLILGSSKGMECIFHPAGGGPPEHYVGSVKKLGIDIGVTNEAFVGWLVFAPGAVDPDALEGTYVGATAQATVVLGLGANVLVGGFHKSIALQPVSVQGQTGLNVAAGIGWLDLEYTQ